MLTLFYPNCNVLFQFALVHPDFRSADVETQVKALEVPMDLVEAFLGGAMGDPKPKLLNFLWLVWWPMRHFSFEKHYNITHIMVSRCLFFWFVFFPNLTGFYGSRPNFRALKLIVLPWAKVQIWCIHGNPIWIHYVCFNLCLSCEQLTRAKDAVQKASHSQPGSSSEGATTLGGRTKWSANWGIVDGHLVGHEEIQDLDG